MGREEQIEEREVLDSIFPEEITDTSETSYRVSIALDVPGQYVEDEDGSERPTILLTVSYPPTYPDVAPDLDLTFPPGDRPSARPPHLSLPDDKPQLLETLTDPIAESLGLAMIFTLITTLKESAEALIAQRLSDEQAVLDRKAAAEEEKENAKFYGERVTRERFLAWREQFREDVARKKEEEERVREEEAGGVGRGKTGRGKEERKLTGKELWERGLVGKVDEDAEAGEEKDALSGMEGLRVKE